MPTSRIRISGIAAIALFLGACGSGIDTNRSEVNATARIAEPQATATDPLSVDLSKVANVYGIAKTGVPVAGGGIDGRGYAYAAALTGTSIVWDGATFVLGVGGTANAVSNATVALPAGNYSAVQLLATGVNGNQANQTFIVHYTDGSSTSIVQSLSDWHTPQGYAGESTVKSMAYRIMASGATQNGLFDLYGYSFTLNGAKTIQSITLPRNRNVVALAVNLVPAGAPPVAASPTMSPPPGTYSTAQMITLSDTTPGAAIYYTTDGTPPTTSSAQYSVPLPVSVTTTIEAMAVASGYANSAVVTGTYTITGSGTVPVSVNLSKAVNVYGIAKTGSPVAGGGIDGRGYAYAAALTGTSIVWGGATFVLGVGGTANAVSNATVALPAGNYSAVRLLATGVNGNQANQTFIVHYTDGSSTSIVQSLSDWHTPQSYAGESTAWPMAYRIMASGATQNGLFDLYGYSFTVNGAKIIQSITLPGNRNVVVLAITLIPVASSNLVCDPLTYGAVGDGTTDNTGAIQSAVDDCAAQGGGIVRLRVVGNDAVYLTGPFTLKDNIQLQIDKGVTLQATNAHSRYVGAYINWVYQPKEALISAKGATGVGIIGAGIIDGAGNQPQPNGGPSWWSLGAVSNATVALPAGNYSAVQLLATGVNGNQANQTFIVHYTDGSSTSIVQSLSDWHTPQGYAGESTVKSMAYRIMASGATQAELTYLYGYSFTVNGAKTIQSITLPSNPNVVVLAVDLVPAGALPAAAVSVDLSKVVNVTGIAETWVPVTGGGIDGRGNAYAEALTGTSIKWGGATFALGGPANNRPWLLEFYQCDHVTISGVTLQNAPMWNQALRFSNDIAESFVTVIAPAASPNTDGVDLVGSTNVTLSDLNISVGDDNIAIKSGLPIDPKDPKQTGLPQMATSQVQISNITAGSGHGISIGSEASNGVNNVTIENVHYTYTGNGFRIKTARDRGGQIHDITVKDITMTGVAWPLIITAYYPGLVGPDETCAGCKIEKAQPITPTTPYVHDITIEGLTATGATQQSSIEGLPESCIHNVTLNTVSITTSITTKVPGIALRHVTGAFTNVTSTPTGSDLPFCVQGQPFCVQENVSIATAGTTPAIPVTPPLTGQTACSAQVVPGQ